MHNRNQFVVWFQDGILVWMPTVTLVRTSLNGLYESVDGTSVMDLFGIAWIPVAITPHLP